MMHIASSYTLLCGGVHDSLILMQWIVMVGAQKSVSISCFVQDLKKKYSRLRRTRGDGNCFFRALAFAYLEVLLKDKTDFQR